MNGRVPAGARWGAVLAVAAIALAGCGAGKTAQTADMETAISGVNVDAGDLALRDLQIDFGTSGFYEEGGQAPLRVWIANQGTEPVVLERVTSPAAETVTLVEEFTAIVVEETETPEGEEGETPEGEPTKTPEDEDATETPTAEPTETPTAEATEEEVEEITGLIGEQEFAIEIAPSEFVRLTPAEGPVLLLEGLKRDIGLGDAIEVVFEFSNGQSATAMLPFGEPAEPVSPSYFGEPGEETPEGH